MQLAGVKRRLPNPPILTVARDSKRRKPLPQVAGNTVTPRPVAQTVVAQDTPFTSQQHVASPRSTDTVTLDSPNTINELWDIVRAKNRTTESALLCLDNMAPRGASAEITSNSTREDKTRRGMRASGSRAGGRAASESAAEDTEDRTTTTSASRAIGPQHTRFRAFVLDPRGITLYDQKPKARPPETHFGTKLPPDGNYAADPLHSHTPIWVSVDASRAEVISRHYSFMEKMRLSEDQFATYAKQNFFKCEEWELNLPHDRLWRGERIDTFVNPAEPAERWCAPPLLLTQQAAGDGYRWDVRPDCAYWLSNRGFNEDYAEAIPGCCFVYRGWTSNPYFTVEFKKNDWKPGVAATQLLTAAAIALYNRYELRAQAKDDVAGAAGLRHYGVTFEGSQFVVYVVMPTPATNDSLASIDVDALRPRIWPAEASRSAGGAEMHTSSWHGCGMRRLAQGDCTVPRDVQRLANWINEIHRWGITKYAQSVQRDIKSALADDGIDVSALDNTAY